MNDDDDLAAEIAVLGDVLAAASGLDQPTRADIDRLLGIVPVRTAG